jgi:class 3 adenylate cyclase
MGLAEAGQVVVTDAVAAALAAEGGADDDLVLVDAGWHLVRDHTGPVRLRQLVGDRLTVVLPDNAAFALAR